MEIENPHLSTSRYQRRDEVLSDEAAAACNQYPCHAGERGSITYDAMPITVRGAVSDHMPAVVA